MSAANASGRASLYRALAEALATPPDWLSTAGRQWPLFEAALDVAEREDCAAIRLALPRLAVISAEDPGIRQARYQALFSVSGPPHICLYESLARDGKLAGPSTLAVWSIYEAAGLSVADAELPDHASVELAFLAYLTEQETRMPSQTTQWRAARRLFIHRHAGQWLPDLGEALAQTEDPVYGPIGRILAVTLRTDLQPGRRPPARAERCLPAMPQPDICSLCSFCVQVCPSRALAIHETEETTMLLLIASKCIACERCVRVCIGNALRLLPATQGERRRILRQSPRAHCPACGQPTVSQAELDEVAARIGAPTWLDYCSACRPVVLERAL
jgi:nitrate reductase assembly molybdenum cofactor insertion protein NarJ/NAD-dependent dihydropyrimidine dehydrogenase PreA subunit